MQLFEYWPDFLAELKEFQALAQAQQPELDAARTAARQTADQFFIQTLPPEGAGRWERLLNLPLQTGGCLENRRFRVMTLAAEQRPFTLPRLEQLLATLCGEGGASIHCQDNQLTVRLALTAKQNYNDVGALLERLAPLNLAIELSLMYNQHQLLHTRTHEQLRASSHEQIRNEVI
jgi:hypothetical protein